MSLDKQRILSELGSVMNQLQSADCGCMGKLFNSNQGHGGQPTMGSPLPTCGGCRRGCCQGHGYGYAMPNAGEPYQANPAMNMNRPCMGRCNPPKLYADTYNYLNNNLMQPVVQEVYNDLKSITPENTIMNSPVAGQVGMPNSAPVMNSPVAGQMLKNAGNAGMSMTPRETAGANMNQMQTPGMAAGNLGNQMQNMSGMSNMSNMGGMGPEIAKMILGEGGAKQSSPQNISGQGQLPGSMLIDAPKSPHGQVGVTPLNQTAVSHMNANMNQGQLASNAGTYGQNPTMQYMSQPGVANTQNMPLQGNMVQNPGNQQMRMPNPAAQQMAAPNQRQYGQHTQGVRKFNEMFPGVMQGGDLGFDPMAIAIQMNPANQQKAAMETMQNLMSGNKAGNVTQPASPPANLAQPQYTDQQIVPPAQNQQMQPVQQQIDNSNAGALPPQQSVVPPQQQQVYTAVTGNQQQLYQQSQQNQDMIDSNTGAPVMSGNEVINQPNTQMQQQLSVIPESETPAMQQMNKEPIFPADNSRNQTYHHTKPHKHYEYNTLGQPVQMLPAQLFHPPEPSLPQTLSPQPVTTKLRNDPTKYSNVKSTVSKTSIMGIRQPGKSLSKSQLQHIYNQYKGSQSYTQQNVPPVQAPTHSDGKLNVTRTNAVPLRQVPVERVGGDTIANNPQITEKVEQVMGQVGDVPASNKPHEDVKAASAVPERQAKLRNGLQDVVYTSYPSSAAWSFHGANDHRPRAVGYRFRELK